MEEKKFEMTEEQFKTFATTLVANSLKSLVEQMGLDKIDKKFLMHAGEDETTLLAKSPEQRFASLMVALKKRDAQLLAKAVGTQTEGVPADGGVFVPPVVMAKILQLIPNSAQARTEMTVMPMGKATDIKIPKRVGGLQVSWIGETQAIPTGKATFDTIQMLAKKAGLIVPVSNELLSDANVDMGAYLIGLMAEAVGIAEDEQFFRGVGLPFKGVFNKDNAYAQRVLKTLETVSYDDLVDLTYGVPSNLSRGANFYMHRTAVATVRKIKDSTGKPIFVDANSGSLPTLLGYNVKMIESAPTANETKTGAGLVHDLPYLLFGNLKNSYIGNKTDIAIKLLEEATVGGVSLAEQDMSAIRVLTRVGFTGGLTEAYSVFQTPALV